MKVVARKKCNIMIFLVLGFDSLIAHWFTKYILTFYLSFIEQFYIVV